MKIREHLLKCLSRLLVISVVIMSVSVFAQQSMSLGDLEFVMPNEKVLRTNRTLHMKMARTGISSRVIAKVGGVAFIQTAEPDFNVKSLSLGVDYSNNTAYATINDSIYIIPLEIWELQSIVNYANQDNNAAVTLYGNDDVRIQYHEAFIDNLMGLRILQADLMLTDFLKYSDRGKFPAYSDGEFIFSPNEKNRYNAFCSLDSILFGYSYEDLSVINSFRLGHIIDSIGDKYDTYIYTDYDQSIKFRTSNGEIVFDGNPYYRFALRDSVLVDTLEMYYEIENFVELFNNHKTKYKTLSISDIFRKSNNFTIYDLEKSISKNKNIQKKASETFEKTNYYALCDTFALNRDNNVLDILITKLPVYYIETFADSVVRFGSKNQDLNKLCIEFLSIKDSLEYYDYPIVTAYTNMIYKISPNDSSVMKAYEISKEYRLNYDRLLIEYMFHHRIPIAKTAENITKFLRENSDYIYMMNPIVFDATEKVCQWSAFFRYVKENYNEEWGTFVNEIKNLKYDAPIVKTPIDFK